MSPAMISQMIGTRAKIGDAFLHEIYHNCQSLQLAVWMMTVCDVLLVVEDWIADLAFWKFLRTALSLQAALQTLPQGIDPYLSSSSHGSDSPARVFPRARIGLRFPLFLSFVL